MSRITSRQNSTVQRLRKLGLSAAYRRECGELLGAGGKLLEEANASGLEITLLWTERECSQLGYISGMQSAPDCVFSARIPAVSSEPSKWIIMEDIQDPGNVGTILRSAGAFGFGAVLAGDCADPWQLKVLRGSMGAAFRVPIVQTANAADWVAQQAIPLYGTSAKLGQDVRAAKLPERFAIAIGNEGRGLQEATLAACRELLTIPIAAESESLNAAVAAGIIMFRV